MNDAEKHDAQLLEARIRIIAWVGVVVVLLTALVWLAVKPWRPVCAGLLFGEIGGAYAVYSLIRYGHRKGGVEGRELFLSGMLGMVTRFIVLAMVIVVAVKLPGVNAYAALIGYLLGFVTLFVGLYGYARNRGTSPREK